MNWIIAAWLMFISSVFMYLAVRYASRLHISSAMQNVSMFVIPTLLYVGLSVVQDINLSLNLYQWLIMIIAAIGFSYLGSKFSLDSLAAAPNPGYSLIISKSYVVLTAIASIFLFDQELTLRSVISILCIVGFSALIMIDPKVSRRKGNLNWLVLAISAFLCWGGLALASKYLFNLGVPVMSRLVWVSSIASLLFIWDAKKQLTDIPKFNTQQILIFGLIGMLSAVFNYFMQVGIQFAPNVGYINAVNASSISAVTVGATLLFRDDFSKRKFIGVIGVTLGLIMLVI